MENVEYCTLAAIVAETVQAICVRSMQDTKRKSHSTNRIVPSSQMTHLRLPTVTGSARIVIRNRRKPSALSVISDGSHVALSQHLLNFLVLKAERMDVKSLNFFLYTLCIDLGLLNNLAASLR